VRRCSCQIDGIILDIKTRLLKTNQIIVDALLGRGVALDDYNVQLQKAAVAKQELENQKTALGLEIVGSVTDPDARAKLFQEIFVPSPTVVSSGEGQLDRVEPN
jgi:hypothetical protein